MLSLCVTCVLVPPKVKLFISKELAKKKVGTVTPGPVYHVPSTVGKAPSFSFGSDVRKHSGKKYPDSSVDLIGATVDTQKVKFHRTPQVHLGSERQGFQRFPPSFHGFSEPNQLPHAVFR